MIRGLHGLFYSSDADATRAFMRDALRLPSTDVGDGWLIFDLPECDLGVHPTGGGRNDPPANTHDVSFYCDDIQGTVAELRARGVQFKSDPQDHGYGWVTYFTMPGGVEVQLYEPKYQKGAAAKPAGEQATGKQPAGKKAAAKGNPNDQGGGKQAAGKQAPGKQAPGKQAPGKQAPGKQAPGKQAPGKQARAKPSSAKKR